ncbi:HPr kinase [Paenibacillus sp. CCS19]|uniref:ATP-binding cassette domain-containing protein n=1 Tax=Paenibacillus sp. CCS19 TaxID=3158387 RepID=UPI002568DFEF|nr:ATP-binding cassette domain-containing protein [Paenibacillus cellulosilyticus]GMK40056.1 HPr kinase [Paenibacillus cellulosilyticus]
MNRYSYQAFGLRIASELALPEALASFWQEALEDQEPDVTIVYGDLQQAWNESEIYKSYYAFSEEQFMMHIPDLALFSVQEGMRITVSPYADADENKIRLYLLGTCMGAILLQRRIVPLHGSAIVIHGKAYAIVGESGAGKSTLAAALLQEGYKLLTDDVIALTWRGSDQQIPAVIPAYPQQKLWEQSLDHLGMNAGFYSALYENKFAVPVASRFSNEVTPLGGIVELVKNEELEETTFTRYEGIKGLHVLHTHTFRNFLIPKFGLAQWHFTETAKLCSTVPIYQLQRPSTRMTISDLAERIVLLAGAGRHLSSIAE